MLCVVFVSVKGNSLCVVFLLNSVRTHFIFTKKTSTSVYVKSSRDRFVSLCSQKSHLASELSLKFVVSEKKLK